MIRSGFKPRFERKPERQMDYTPRPRPTVVALATRVTPLVAVPKRVYVRSEAIILACRGLACMHCGAAGPDAGVCAAHSNWSVHGKGGHIKADDNRVAALCKDCHVPILDQGSKLSAVERQSMWWWAHVKTIAALREAGEWPPDVPLPDILNCPFSLASV